MNDIINSFRPDLFAGRSVFVSGATSGIGLAIARGFSGLGAQVVATGSSESKLVQLREDESLKGIRFERMDVRDTHAVSRVIGAQERIDVLINAAGVARPADEYEEDIFELVMDVNLKSGMRLTMAARPQLEASRGVVINIASMLSYMADTAVPAYCASKTGILGLTRALAHQFGPLGIRVNAIAPGYHRTDMTKSLWDEPASADKIANRTALKRWGEAEDLVGAALFLASPAGSYITGETIAVDGGYISGS